MEFEAQDEQPGECHDGKPWCDNEPCSVTYTVTIINDRGDYRFDADFQYWWEENEDDDCEGSGPIIDGPPRGETTEHVIIWEITEECGAYVDFPMKVKINGVCTPIHVRDGSDLFRFGCEECE